MRILFLLYNNFISNSAIHVHNFANALVENNHECIVAVPDKKETAQKYMEGNILYTPLEFQEVNNAGRALFNGKSPDIIHAWTPRDIVRKQYLELKKKFPSSKLVIHLEDNETIVLQKITGLPVFLLKLIPQFLLQRIVSDMMSHPRHYKKFIKTADGITIIMDTLVEFVSNKQPHLILWPIINSKSFSQINNNSELMKKLGIAKDDLVIAYTGNVHPSNADEIRTLYRAVGMANQDGTQIKLIRTGSDICDFLTKDDEWVRQYVIELGFVERESFVSYLALADILIQPGHAGRFNDYRLPSKIPEFLATGKPVVVPNTNIGRFLKDGQEAIILQKGDEQEIVGVIEKLKEDKELKARISKGGRAFALHHFNEEVITGKLVEFYQQILRL